MQTEFDEGMGIYYPNNEFMDLFLHSFLLHHQPCYFEEGSKLFGPPYFYDLFEGYEGYYFVSSNFLCYQYLVCFYYFVFP
jgi:hypothetical protein